MRYRSSMQDIHSLSSLLGLTLFFGVLSNLQAEKLPDFTQLIEQYGPAVVNISTTTHVPTVKDKPPYQGIPGLPHDNPLQEFFGHFFDKEDNESFQRPPAISSGSGFILSADGYVVTNYHVIEDTEQVIVRLTDRRELFAQLIGVDKRSDLALLKVDATDLPAVKLGSTQNLKVGEWVLAIGSPFGFEHSATAGIVSAKGRSLPDDTYIPFIQTDVAINPGNSGGPLFNLAGEVIGINSQIYSRTGSFMGLSFAIPVDVMVEVVEQLKVAGAVSRGWLGIYIQEVTRELAQSFGMDKPQGALVAKVLPNSPAMTANLQIGDVITFFNGQKIARYADLPPIVGSTQVGTSVVVVVIRQGQRVKVKMTIAKLPEEEEIQLAATHYTEAPLLRQSSFPLLGLTVVDLEKNQRLSLDVVEGGVLVQQVEEGPSWDAGLNRLDVIMMIDNINIKNVLHFKEILNGLNAKTVPVLVHRQHSPLFLALKLP
ncbi:Do family serine endopeptidase [Candidatus Parabeggiatoa sp. HSG14]|uniref:Do family serine endopeptidase n=1 Tax=Candidatus Parabeggiatoa sp. HSG14 TaxID=3055593 RepID=UPI0025A82049|nr:Do family serine endopeptidase [Thiotrichales bacterium HSG14]